ncbi:hypothetical protein VPNG_09447 [Cytospora leucostoma]|uniref:Histidine acid phosphatase n=1 Tax=Cytospora leucostoma TaxID=1230097 RepID=A0A423VPU2_9PEZI|nr:hypothetical protein VPNG_09447 [Cytospora leucostoma]
MANSTTVDLGWYPPSQTLINNLTNVVSNGTTGVYGFIYNSSYTPDDEYGTYNWCNMPHVRAKEYVRPSEEYELVYVELIHRHHKRTPYAANSFPVESYTWDCNDEGLYYFARPFSSPSGSSPSSSPHPDAGRNSSALTYWETFSGLNPFEALASGWKGTCQFPQITSQGLDDSWQHGADLYAVYHDLLGFLPDRDEEDWRDKVRYRVTNNVITSEVAGMVINGMWNTTTTSVPLLIQPDGVDSLEPDYTCTSSSTQFSTIQSAGGNPAWAAHLEAAAGVFAALDSISGVASDDSGFHASFDHYYDNLSARQCHGKPLPCKLVNGTGGGGAGLVNDTQECVTQGLADEVYRFGNWEYSQVYRDSGAESLAASVGSFGVWVAELAAHLRGVIGGGGGGGDGTIWFHNVAHDGSVSRLLGVLQVDVMVWPGMGSEVVFEVWKGPGSGGGGSNTTTTAGAAAAAVDSGKKGSRETREKDTSASGYYIRVLFGGRVLTSSNPSLGTLDLVPVEILLA